MDSLLIRDANLRASCYLPAAGATANSSPNLNLGPGDWKPLMDWEVGFPALPNHTNPALSITATLQDSADGVTWANVSPQIQISVAGVAVTGSLATTQKFRQIPNIRQYVRVQFSVPVGDGNCTAAQPYLQVLL